MHLCLDCGTRFAARAEQETQQPRPQPAAKKPTPKRKLDNVGGVVAEAKRELRALNAEIARLEKLKKQRDQLVRLLAAAKQPATQGNVRRLRANGE